MIRSLAIFVVAVLLLANGCGAVGNPPEPTGDSLNVVSEGSSMPGARSRAAESGCGDQDELGDQWQAILADPGEPGVDYDPTNITVNYFAGAKLLEGLAAKPQPGRCAADRSNAILRENQRFEAITDAIAATYGLAIDQQVYINNLNFASFMLPEGADGDAVIQRIRDEFADAVEYVTYSRLMHPSFEPNDEDYVDSTATSGRQWGQRRIGCSEAWDYTRGEESFYIAIVDTGCRLSHEELEGQVLDPEVYFPDETLDLANDDNTMEDTYGHGTMICGIVGAISNNERRLTGVAPGCRIIPVKFSEDENGGSHARFVAGCMLGFQLGARVVNLSWHSGNGSPELLGMVNDIYNGGGLLFASAGNEGNSSWNYPAKYTNTVASGNSNPDDSRYSSSCYGDWVDIATPGVQLISTRHEYDWHYAVGTGTSFSSPITACAAALLWCYDPTLTNDDIRYLLETTGAPTTGFNATNSILRLDIAAAFRELTYCKITMPAVGQLVQSGTVVLEPGFSGEFDSANVYLDGELVDSLYSAPWSFSIDTTSIDFGTAIVRFELIGGEGETEAELPLFIDNTAGVFPVIDLFEPDTLAFQSIDPKGYSEAFLTQIKQLPEYCWTVQEVAEGGPAVWGFVTGGSVNGDYHAECVDAENSYGAHELDVLISQRIDLTGVADPTLVFYHHYNIETWEDLGDHGWVHVTSDDGLTFVPAQLKDGGDAAFTGYLPDWQKVEVDLADYADQIIHLAFVLESDASGSGQQEDEPAGWWVDQVCVAGGYLEHMPLADGFTIEPQDTLGIIPWRKSVQLNLLGARGVSSVYYTLDCDPVGTVDSNDLELVITNGETFSGIFNLHAVPVHNQQALLRIQYFDIYGNPGVEFQTPVYLFNFLGDTNADGEVNQLDLDAYAGMLGLCSADPGYVPFFDSDFDGLITEADASAVGYHWGAAQ